MSRLCTALGCVSTLVFFAPGPGFAHNNSISVGYGFGFLNKNIQFAKLRGTNGSYDFIQVSYGREKALHDRFGLLVGPFVAYISRPQNGVDLGVTVSLKGYLQKQGKSNLFATLGTGTAYTTIGFHEQGTHLLFVLQASVGYQWKGYFLENRFRHYSNGGMTSPNRAVNANIVNVGMSF
jgi:hypothetical protein